MITSTSCFMTVKDWLDDLYPKIEACDDAEKDLLIMEEFRKLRIDYSGSNLKYNPKGIDYSNLVTQFAYIYKYVVAHSNMVYGIIKSSKHLRGVFDQEEISVACLGIGPGSDLLGIRKYGKSLLSGSRLYVNGFDREKSWKHSWSFLKSPNPIHVLDVNCTKKIDDKRIQKADLITMVYFLSELYVNRDATTAFFDDLFTQMKPGATILFIDNGNNDYAPWFDTLIGNHNFKYIYDINGYNYSDYDDYCYQINTEEDRISLGQYYQKFALSYETYEKEEYPVMRSIIACRICCKQ